MSTSQSTSPSLLERLRQTDDREAWFRFVDLYTPLLLTWVRRLRVMNQDRADLVQDVFRELIKVLPKFQYDPSMRFRVYLFQIARAKVSDHFRRSANAEPTCDIDAQQLSAPDFSPEWIEQDYNAHIFRRAAQLIAKDFDVATAKAFHRYMIEGEAPATVAADLGISTDSVYQARVRVLKRLREEFGDLFN